MFEENYRIVGEVIGQDAARMLAMTIAKRNVIIESSSYGAREFLTEPEYRSDRELIALCEAARQSYERITVIPESENYAAFRTLYDAWCLVHIGF